MKQIIYTIALLILIPLFLQAQTVSSTCEGSNELLDQYDFDATKLAIRDLYNNASADTNVIIVDEHYKLRIMDALLAVHQAYNLPARDEVVDFFNIHALGVPATNSFIVYADTSYEWVNLWAASDICSGVDELDRWVDSLEISFVRSPEMVYHEQLGTHLLKVNFKSELHLNLQALFHKFLMHDAIVDIQEEHYFGETEKDIQYQFDDAGNYADLTYSYRWGNCQSGCTNEHYWAFRVYFDDCSVAFLSDGGDILQINNPSQISQISIFPNPTVDLITINLIGPAKADFSYWVYDAHGQLLHQEDLGFHNGFINLQVDLSPLPIGVYFVSFSYENQILTEQVIKR